VYWEIVFTIIIINSWNRYRAIDAWAGVLGRCEVYQVMGMCVLYEETMNIIYYFIKCILIFKLKLLLCILICR